MTQIKKLGIGAVAAALFALMAMATMVNTADAAGPVASADIDCGAAIQVSSTATYTCAIEFDDATPFAAAATVNGVQVTVTTTLGTFVENNQNSITFVCGQLFQADSCDTTGTPITVALNTGTTSGTNTVLVTAGGIAATAQKTLQSAATTAGAPAAITGSFIAGATSHIAPDNASASPAYVSPNDTSTVTFRVVDAAATPVGVNNRLIQLSTSAGRIAAVGACDNTSGTTVALLTNTVSGVAGRVQADVCGAAASQVGVATVTARDLQGTNVSGSVEVTLAGPAASVTTTVSGGQVVVNVVDSEGRPVADGTGVALTIASTVGSAAPAVTTTTNGSATFAVALTGTAGNGIVSVGDGATGTPLALTGATRVNQSISLTQSTTPPPAEGDGAFASAPNFGTGNVGSAVFNGGSIADLADATADAGGTGVWVQGTDGNWYRYTVGATGATAFVNNAFNAQFEDGFAGATAVFVVK
ncbi:MAG: hypothetical protein M0R75_13295 [Dehalococcoidia bacterium]|nr:hypothetical protein [Dehalococcoidia bacterium]